MKVTRVADRRFRDFTSDGAQEMDLWNDGLGVTAKLYTFPKGSSYPEHTHDTWEQLYMISGRLRISETILETGDFAFTEPCDTHSVDILEDTLVLISFGKQVSS